MVNWPRQIPIAGEPPDVVALVQQDVQWLSTSGAPKLFINADPGSILVGKQRAFRRSWPNQKEVTPNDTLESQMERETRSITQMIGTQDAREGIKAFVAKRKPNFVGG